MKHSRISPDDPKLTAYALGELAAEERAAIEAALIDDAEARAAVEEISALAGQLEAALANEPDAVLRQQAARAPRQPKVLRFPQVAWVGGTLAAACVAVLVALHPREPVAVREFRIERSSAAKAVPAATDNHATDGGRSQPTTQARDTRDLPTAPTPTAQAPTAQHRAIQGAEMVSGSPAFAADNSAVHKSIVGSPLLQQVKPSLGMDLGGPTSPQFAYNGASLAVETPRRKPGLVSLSAEPGAGERRRPMALSSAARAHAWSAVDVSGRLQATTIARASRRSMATYGSYDGPTYYYPPDDKFVVPAEPRIARPFVVPAPPPPVNGETWETVPKPQPPWGAGKGPSSFGYIEAPKPFAFQLPQDWDNSIARHPYLPRGPFDLLPGPRLDVRRFPLIRTQSRAGGDTESYAYLHDNRFVAPADAPFSTFSIDVDTASYANVRRFIDAGRWPPPDAVRIEELLNYFPYRYAPPAAAASAPGDGAAPLGASLEVAAAPWAPTHRLVRIGLKAREIPAANRPPANLVFLLDVSGSMAASNKLPLVKDAMRLLIDALRPDDRVAMVTYAGTSGLALPSTPVSQSADIDEALDALAAGGSTNGGMGIQLAYDVAKANFVKGGSNRVILCTDGDFNVGVTNQGDLVRLIEEKARSGVMLTVLGFGMGNYKDSTLELLADKGNGNYGYIDNRSEATKLLRDQVDGTLNTVAKDVKVQVDFNPARVARYRLIGYEDRALNAQDFNDDAVDAGEMGAGHTVTALYEIVPVGAEEGAAPQVDASRYAPGRVAAPTVAGSHANELLTVKIRYKDPAGDVSRKLEFPLVDGGGAFAQASADFKFAAAVAEFGMILRHSPCRGQATLGDVIASAAAGSASPGDDPRGYRRQFVELALEAERLLERK